MQGNLDILVVLSIITLIIPVAIWNNWIFTGPDGYNLTGKDRPSLLRFYAILLRHPIQAFNGRIFWPKQPAEPTPDVGTKYRRQV